MRKSHLWEEFEGRHLRMVKALRQERRRPRQAGSWMCRPRALGEAGPEIIVLRVIIRAIREICETHLWEH